MRSLRSRLSRIEERARREDQASRAKSRMLSHRLSALLVLHEPGMALVRAEHTDPETYRDIQETLAWARGDFTEAERLRGLDPNRHIPLPPGTPWEEQMRQARAAFDALLPRVEEQSERVNAAIRAATGAAA